MNAMSRLQPLKPFGFDDDANEAVQRALRPGYLYAKRRIRLVEKPIRNPMVEAEERNFIQSIESDLMCLCPAHVSPEAFRDAVQTVLQTQHGRRYSLAPLVKATSAERAGGRDHDLRCHEAEELVAKRQLSVNSFRKKLEAAQRQLREAQVLASDAQDARDRYRAAAGGAR